MQKREVILIASGDLRLSANQTCWPAQQKVEEAVTTAIQNLGSSVRRGHAFDPLQGHGFIHSFCHRCVEVEHSHQTRPLSVPIGKPGLMTHRGPILAMSPLNFHAL